MDVNNNIPIANYIFVTITGIVLAFVTATSENGDKSYTLPPEYNVNKTTMTQENNITNENSYFSYLGSLYSGNNTQGQPTEY